VLTPTRELAAQVAQSARDYGKYMQLRTYQVFGGVSINPQISALQQRLRHLWLPRPGGCSISRSSAPWTCQRCRYWCSMKPTGCSTWVSFPTFAGSLIVAAETPESSVLRHLFGRYPRIG